MQESLFKYLAGLCDADGSLSFNFKRDQNRHDRFFYGLTFHLCAADAVDRNGFVASLPQITGFGTIVRYGAKKQFVNWIVSKRSDIEMLLPRLIKHMVLKARHWQWMLEYWRDHRGQEYSERTVSEQEREALTAAVKESRRSRVGPLKLRNHPTWAWLAGYLDGDGCYTHRECFAKSNGYWQLESHITASAHINDLFVLDWLQKSFGGTIMDHSATVKIWKRALGFGNRDFALRFLPKIVKHSRFKQHKIEKMISYMRERTSRNNRPQRLSVPGPTGQATV